MRTRVALIAAGLLAAVSWTVPVGAAEMTWHFRNNHPNAVDIGLFGATRNWRWPSNTTVWTHDGSGIRSYTITCVQGEYICYGAGLRGNYRLHWGRGMFNASAGCTACCYRCEDGLETSIFELNP